jgi:hypothetical protein
MKPPVKNVGASVRARLTDRARAGKEDVQLLFTRYAIERLLYRLAQSKHRDTFVLKGAMLFSLWAKVPYRSTGDLDLLAFGLSAPDHIAGVFRDICAEKVPDDGLGFDASSVKAEIARPEDEYAGVRVTMTATLANARLPIQVDIGFGDVVTPAAQTISYPTLLDFPAPALNAYPRETVVAEKLEALVSLGMNNSRMKDFFDLWAIATMFDFDGAMLASAVAATFAKRNTPLPGAAPPIAFTPAFANDTGKQAQWTAFTRRTQIAMAPAPFADLLTFVASFAMPLLADDATTALANHAWRPGGPWSPKEAPK